MQVLAKNIGKLIVMYTIAYVLNIFVFTLIIKLTFYLIRRHAHGAHAPSSLVLCRKYYTIYTFTFE